MPGLADGRQVRKGEKGVIIFVPYRRRVRESPGENKAEQQATATHAITGFGFVATTGCPCGPSQVMTHHTPLPMAQSPRRCAWETHQISLCLPFA